MRSCDADRFPALHTDYLPIADREAALLIDEKESSLATRQRVAQVVAHELSHQVRLQWELSTALTMPLIYPPPTPYALGLTYIVVWQFRYDEGV